MNVGASLIRLAPGEKFMPIPDERGVRWMLRTSEHGNARMLHRKGVLYLAMKHGHQFPDGLTACDHDRAAALGWLLEDLPFASWE